MDGADDINSRFYDASWTDAELQSPERFNTWPLIRRLALTPTVPRSVDCAPQAPE
jgi:hypothetical protein